jgi:hypothetical protein
VRRSSAKITAASFQTRFGAGQGDVRIETFSGDATLQLL